jgi:hypothetical protein
MEKQRYIALPTRALLLCMAFFFICASSAFAQIITTYAGNGTDGYTGDGYAATSATLDSITSIAYDKQGNLYINDQHAHCVRKVSSSGVITTLAGTGTAGFFGDGGPAVAAQLHDNWGVAVDTSGNVYITDQTNQCVRKVTTTGIITTIAGIPGAAGYDGDGGPATAAKLNTPIGVATDRMGNVYIGDYANKVIRKVSASGTISTVAGTGIYGYYGDGGLALNAQLSYVYGLATDYTGNLYICDGYNNRVRKVSTTGTITTVAGNGAAGSGGDGSLATGAQLNRPTGVYVTSSGELYISDCRNNRIREVNTSGIISTVAGNGVAGYSGDGINAVGAAINSPLGVSMDLDGNVAIADRRNYRVRRIIKSVTFVNGKAQFIESCENAVLAINNLLKVQDYYPGYTDTWTLSMTPMHGTVNASYSAVSTGGVLIPIGLTYTPGPGFTGMDSFRVQVSNGAVTDLTTIRVKIDPVLTTAGAISGPSEVCEGSNIVLTSGMPGGTWSCADANVSIIGGPGCSVGGVNAGTVTISYTLSNFCGPISSIKIVTVHPLPDPGAVTGLDAVCKGGTVTLAATVPGGTWNSSNGNTSIINGVVTGLNAGAEVVRYTVANAWCQATIGYPMVVEVFPYAGSIQGVAQICAGESATITDSVLYGVWRSGNANATVLPITPSSPAHGVVTGLATGLASISYSLTNSCGTADAMLQVFVAPVPDAPVINEHDGELNVTGLYQSYQWLKNGVAIPGAVADQQQVQYEALYAIVVGNSYGCKVTSKPFAYGCDPSTLTAYPNPVTATMQLSWCRPVTARVVSVDGRIVRTFTNTNQVDFSGMPDGIYVVDILDDNKSIRTLKVTRIVGN